MACRSCGNPVRDSSWNSAPGVPEIVSYGPFENLVALPVEDVEDYFASIDAPVVAPSSSKKKAVEDIPAAEEQ